MINKLEELSINQSINQSIKQSSDKSTSRSTNKSLEQICQKKISWIYFVDETARKRRTFLRLQMTLDTIMSCITYRSEVSLASVANWANALVVQTASSSSHLEYKHGQIK